MRYVLFAVVAVGLSACNPAPSPDGPSHDGMEMSASSAAVRSGTGTGVVKAVDLKVGTVTLDHGPIAAVGWPAMTMTFPVKPASALDGVAVGQTVTFDVTVTDNKPVITAIRK